jgi:hypothetical protein
MQIHGRAKLGRAGRLALCQAIEGGLSLRRAAGKQNVSPTTDHLLEALFWPAFDLAASGLRAGEADLIGDSRQCGRIDTEASLAGPASTLPTRQEATLIVGIDVHKHNHAAALGDARRYKNPSTQRPARECPNGSATAHEHRASA